MSYWRIPRMWQGRTVAVLASGPSMSATVSGSVAHLPRIVTNRTFELAPDADVIVGNDADFWRTTPAAVACPGVKVCVEVLPGVRPDLPPGVLSLRNTGRLGFDPRPDCVRTLTNSGGVALQIAIHAGAARVLLLGFDMRGGHWHEPHAGRNPDAVRFGRWIEYFEQFARAVQSLGVDIVNCTQDSALRGFRVSTLELEIEIRAAA